MKNIFIKTGIILTLIFPLIFVSKVKANDVNVSSMSAEELESYIQNETDIDTTNLDLTELALLYDELTDEYTNEDIANMIQENKEEIMESIGIDEDTLNTATTILSSLDTEEVKQILEEDLNLAEIQEKLESGYTITEIVQEMQEELSTSNKISIGFKLLFASSIVKTILIISGILIIYKIITRWIIFKKAGKHGWAAIIPIYSQVTYLKVSNLSPWWILILIIPIIGWLIYVIIKIISRFTLADSFGRGIIFGFGLLILGFIFESVIAFNRNIKFLEE